MAIRSATWRPAVEAPVFESLPAIKRIDVIMGVLGCLAGIPLGFAASIMFNNLPTIGTYLSFKPSLDIILPSVAAGIALSALGSLYPAWRAVSQTPADALRRA